MAQVDTTKPDFVTAAQVEGIVAAAVAAAVTAERSAQKAKDIPQTSVAIGVTSPGEVSVQFRRWCAYGNTAYQRGQFAGFPAAVALELELEGAVIIDPAHRREPAGGRMVRK